MTQPVSQLSIKLERATPSRDTATLEIEKCISACAAAALGEAIANSVAIEPPRSRLRREDLLELRRDLATGAWEAANLAGESPLEPLHQEFSGWGLPIEQAPEIPWQVLAIDVLDFLAFTMRPDDILVWEAGR